MPKRGKFIKLNFNDSVTVRGSLNAVKLPGKTREGEHKASVEIFTGWRASGDPKLPDGIYEERRIDRESDTYEKLWRDASTGKIIGRKKYPLSKKKDIDDADTA